MRLISWNCQGAFKKKADLILALHPDILVVQECEHPNRHFYNPTNKKPDSQYWYGDSKHKGICIHSFNDYKFELLQNFNPKFRYILPFRVTGHWQAFTLFAIWAMSNKENYNARYIGQVWLVELLSDSFNYIGYGIINSPMWDILFISEQMISDSFEFDNKKYYTPYVKIFEYGFERKGILSNLLRNH